MTVIVLASCPAGLRGFLTRWLQEVSPGVFVGRPSARVRQVLWDEVQEYSGNGRALLVHHADNEQGFAFDAHEHAWQPVDHDGLTLIRRPAAGGGRQAPTWTPADDLDPAPDRKPPPPSHQGWSKAAKRRRFGQGR
ncbi:type I-E CRISPR-associated endoribonuclease Cas2e [Streptomyces sp. LE64]|uniref:type I-E CRISPR-associated endoribonuclease Cas2e n=1 Tax=Streptomyces sp. LE64 TaxID=3448653 RepID=UPI00404290CF